MGRVENRMYKRARGQALLRKALVFGILCIVGLGLLVRSRSRETLQAQHLPKPTATPVASAYDETVTSREVALEEVSWYAIQTGIYSTAASANEHRDTYAKRGAPGYVNQDGEKYRVYIACYATKEDAAAVRERLRLNQEVETFLHTWVCPALTLRLTGMVGQLDVVESGLSLSGNAAAALRDAAALLDSGESTTAEALAVVQGLNEQITLWRQTARSRFTAPYPDLITMELHLADLWDAQYTAMVKADGAAALSAAMKLQAMALFDEGCELRQQLMK